MRQSAKTPKLNFPRYIWLAPARAFVPSIFVSEFYKAGNALARFNHPCRNCGNL
jgi:hypothetical protein